MIQLKPIRMKQNVMPRVNMTDGGNIYALATHPDYTRQGLASALVREVQVYVKGRHDTVTLSVHNRDLVSERAWTRS